MSEHDDDLEHSVAILSMACRFPGARDLAAFWRNLADGVESITFFSDAELEAAGNDPAWLRHPNYVKANPVLEDVELFDAAFFDVPPREAEILDPQSRLFLECAWEALERAGYVSEDYEGWIGVFAGSSASTYMMRNLQSRPDVLAAQGWFPVYLANDRDYFATRVSYKLNLKGPSMNVQTACSTSLVAVHQACQSLLDYQCNLALAGGVRVSLPQVSGYIYEPGGITSPDGHCRSFDARGQGSLFGNGAGVVVLKRLDEALADGDAIAAVIRGSAINNDGAAKVGFTAPSVGGQAEVIAMAQSAAGIDVETVTYVEAHGSATALGDPIEVAALRDAFRSATDRKGFCAVGSVKSNFGHLEAAAGIAGLIKTVLALEHRQIPPSLHFEKPNPEIDFEDSPFYVNTELRAWESNGAPRRAGVSSFGMGGTNAHLVVEEAPAPEPSGPSRPRQLLLLSARTPAALERATDALAAFLAAEPETCLADVAYTLRVGRRGFGHRRMLVCRDAADAARTLAERDPERLLSMRAAATGRPVVFLLPGVGEHYADMALGLYREEPAFRDEVDRCARLLAPHLGLDLRDLLYPRGTAAAEPEHQEESGLDLARLLGRAPRRADEGGPELDRTRFAQPAVFTVEYALATLWMSWGVRPEAMLGHSLGEYVAATLAGVLSLEDALDLVAERARLIDRLPAGAMLAVPLAEGDVEPLLGEDLSLSAVNSPGVTVVAGPEAAVDALSERLGTAGVACRRLPATHAFHSKMMEPAAEALTDVVAEMTLRPPRIPFLSNVTGAWITAAEATDPAYWARHLCRTVRFSDGVAEVLGEGERVLLEVGPGQGLGALVLQHPAGAGSQPVLVPALRSRFDRRDDQAFLLSALGRLWLAGVRVDWAGFHGGERRRRLPLPTYPFERRRFWIAPGDASPDERDAPAGEAEEPLPTFHERPQLPTPYAAPGSELERTVAEVWQEVLGFEPIGVHDIFFEMGGHSLIAPKLLLRLEKALDVSLALATLLENPTVARLAARVERARAEGEAVLAETAPVDLAAEVTLDDAIRPARGAEAAAGPPKAVFLTGGTGFLGANLLSELLARTDARVYCLARAESEDAARRRLRESLERHRLWRPETAPRIVAVAGDLSRPRLGLARERFEEIAGEVDAVYHAGAWVNFTYPYRVLEPTNVGGTREALRLAATCRVKPFHYVSSTAVFTHRSIGKGGRVLEDDTLEHTEGLFSGYAQTKWVSEKVLALARRRGIPSAVYRPGVISGHSRTGVGNTSDLVWNVIKGSVQLGGAIDDLPALDAAPVDHVARSIVHLSLGGAPAGEAFHFSNPRPMPWSEVFDALESLGYPLRRLSYGDWQRELAGAAEAGADNALIPFLPLFGEVSETETELLAEARAARGTPDVRYDDTNTLRALEGSGLRCPPLDAKLIRVYVEYFIDSGFLEPPAKE